jgi:hypothetical protein
MKSVITAIDGVSQDNQLRCGMHTKPTPHCSGPTVAVVTYDTRLDVDFSTLEDERAPAA